MPLRVQIRFSLGRLCMELRQALAQVSEIRDHLARTETFRGYRSATIAFTGVVGIATAIAQTLWLPQPADHLVAYLALWVGAAVFNLAIIGVEVWRRSRRAAATFARRNAVFAIEQFVPSLAAGGLVTLVIALRAESASWMLPGLWAVIFSLGIFASCRTLPRAVSAAGVWYVAAGTLALVWGQGDAALSPWIMGVAFGGGQLLTAAILHVSLARLDKQTD